MPMQLIEILLQIKKCDILLICAQNIVCGFSLELPHKAVLFSAHKVYSHFAYFHFGPLPFGLRPLPLLPLRLLLKFSRKRVKYISENLFLSFNTVIA